MTDQRMDDTDALTAVLAEEARARAGAAAEPDEEELLDYLEGRLSPQAEAALQRQLVARPELAARLLDLEAFAAAGRRAESGAADLAARAGWRDFQARRSSEVQGEPAAASRPARPPLWLPAAAAALLVATIGLGFRVMQLERLQDRPVANLASLQLMEATRTGTEQSVELAPGAPLHLMLAPEQRCPVYELLITGPDPASRLSLSGLTRDRRGLLNPLVHPVPGGYTLELFGCEPRTRLAEHRFRVVPPALPPGGDGG